MWPPGACHVSYSRLLALGPIYYEKPFWLIKKVFQSLRTGSSEIFFTLLLPMGAGVNLAPQPGTGGREGTAEGSVVAQSWGPGRKVVRSSGAG